jgi:hypothetical protein
MTRLFFAFACLTVLASASACSSKHEHDPQPGPPPTLKLTVTPTTIPQNTKFHVTVAVTNFTIAEHQHDDHVDPTVGHWHLYVDSTDTDPLEQDGAALEKDLVLPCALAKPIDPGAHKLIARLHFLDHKIVTPEVTSSVDVTVTKGTCMSGAGGGGTGGSGAGGK